MITTTPQLVEFTKGSRGFPVGTRGFLVLVGASGLGRVDVPMADGLPSMAHYLTADAYRILPRPEDGFSAAAVWEHNDNLEGFGR